MNNSTFYQQPYNDAQPIIQPTEEGSGWVAGIALFLAIIAIIFIIIVVFLFSRDIDVAADLVNFWTVVPSGTVTPKDYTASPNSLMAINASIAKGFTVNIQVYTSVASNVIAGSRTTVFKIVNTTSTESVNVTFTGGTMIAVSGTNTDTVTGGQTAEYMWVTATSVQRIDKKG